MTRPETRSWQSIRAEALRRINDRVWPPGGLIPTEADLAAEFGCARATVNRALRDLAEAGLLDRRRKAGTRVAATPVRKARLDIPITRLEIEQQGRAYRHALISRDRRGPPPEVAALLGLAADADMLHVRALHLADDRPHVYEDRWVHLPAVPGFLDVDLETVSANEWLVRNAPFSHGDIVFSAANARGEEAALIGAGEGEALFVLERVTWSGEIPITAVRQLHAPGRKMRMTV